MAKSKLTIIILMTILLVSAYAISTEFVAKAGSSNDDWSMFHHDLTHTGYSTSTPTATSAILLWNYTTGLVVWASPAIVGDYVYIPSDDGNVYCLDALTGAKIWNYTTRATRRGAPIGSSVAVADGYVYFGCWDHNVYCLNASTGDKVWNFTLEILCSLLPRLSMGMSM